MDKNKNKKVFVEGTEKQYDAVKQEVQECLQEEVDRVIEKLDYMESDLIVKIPVELNKVVVKNQKHTIKMLKKSLKSTNSYSWWLFFNCIIGWIALFRLMVKYFIFDISFDVYTLVSMSIVAIFSVINTGLFGLILKHCACKNESDWHNGE
jgi:hypothetical protein